MNKITPEQIKLYKEYKEVFRELKEFIKTDLFKKFEAWFEAEYQKANSIKDIDVNSEDLQTKIIYKKAKIEVMKRIMNYINKITNLGSFAEKELKKYEVE